MNSNAFLFSAKTDINLKLIKQIKNIDIPLTWDESIIRPQIVKGICKLAEISDDNDIGGLGTFRTSSGNKGYAVEITDNGIRYCVVINDAKMLISKGNSGIYNFSPHGKKSEEDGAVLITSILFFISATKPKTIITSTLARVIRTIRRCDKNNGSWNSSDMEKEEFFTALMEISNRLYSILIDDNCKIKIFNEQGNMEKLSKYTIESKKYAPTKILRGSFHILTEAAHKSSKASVDKGKTAENKPAAKFGHEYAGDEKKLIPEIEPWFIRPKEVDTICNMIKQTTGSYRPARNFMLRGPSSTGKTTIARAVAATLKIPYVFLTCSADTESYEFLGQPMYDKDGNVKYVESDFIKAIKNGYLVEVQEPYVITKQGVLTALNGLMDDSAGVTLSTGEIIHRHPDSVIIFTTNVNYVGCRKPNQSVLRRMNAVFDIQQPDTKSIIDRVKAVTKFEDEKILRQMAEVQVSICSYLKKEDIEDGVCGVTELIDWVQAYQYSHDIFSSASCTIVSKATDDTDTQEAIMGLLEAKFDADTISSQDINDEDILTY